jgi:hypothetical protein
VLARRAITAIPNIAPFELKFASLIAKKQPIKMTAEKRIFIIPANSIINLVISSLLGNLINPGTTREFPDR